MKLGDATRKYVANKQAAGMVFEAEAYILRTLTEKLGPNVAIKKITSDSVLDYLNGHGPVTLFWHRKHDALSGFWRFAIQHGYTDRCPVPARRPQKPTPFIPYIYTREELRRLLDGVTSFQKRWCKLEPITLRALLLLMYGAGLRTSEPIRLACSDVDLADSTLTIRVTKFYKTRRIALCTQLRGVLAEYDANRRLAGHSRHDTDSFFTHKKGEPVARMVLEDAFLRLRQHVGIGRQNARYQPRLHDLRHTFAVHRLIAWYRSGADVQRLLPGLSTHMGHISLSGTQRYLTMTPELLAEASLRFEHYAGEVIHGQA
jgi:integrase/recombinase XerD